MGQSWWDSEDGVFGKVGGNVKTVCGVNFGWIVKTVCGQSVLEL